MHSITYYIDFPLFRWYNKSMEIRNKTQQAISLLNTNLLFYADMLECIKRGRAQIIYACHENTAKDGVLLYDKPSGIYMLASAQKAGAYEALSALKNKEVAKKSGWLVVHGDVAREAVYEKLHIVYETPTVQAAYLSKTPLPLQGKLHFAYPQQAEIGQIKLNYDKESPENIERLAKNKKIYCAFAKNEFVGFIGEHPEGSMGMLHIFPVHRRHGYAEELESFLVNEYLKADRIPYGHVVVGNEPSMRLQRKLGFAFAEEKLYWMKEN